MALACPRCSRPLDRVDAAHATGSVSLDACPSCRGVWVDGAELAAVSNDLAEIPRFHPWIVANGVRGGGIAKCPRCAASTIEFPFFEVRLDHCTECHGVWLDGDERVGLARAVDRDEGREPPPITAGWYRSASAAVRTRTTRCKDCEREVALDDTMITGRGVVCDACYRANGARTTADAEDEAFVANLQRADGEWGEFFGRLGTGLLMILAAGGRCSHCGCMHASGCGH